MIDYKFLCLFVYWQWKLANELARIPAVTVKKVLYAEEDDSSTQWFPTSMFARLFYRENSWYRRDGRLWKTFLVSNFIFVLNLQQPYPPPKNVLYTFSAKIRCCLFVTSSPPVPPASYKYVPRPTFHSSLSLRVLASHVPESHVPKSHVLKSHVLRPSPHVFVPVLVKARRTTSELPCRTPAT